MEPIQEVTKILCIILTSQLFLFSFVVMRRKSGTKTHNRMLALLFLAIAISLTDQIIFFHKEATLENTAYALFIFETFQLTVLPLLYLYARTIASTKNRFKLIDLLHFVPFFVSFIDVLLNFSLVPQIEKIEYIKHMPQPSFFASNAVISKGITAVKSLQRIYPLISVLLLLKHRRKLFKQLSSDRDIKKYSNKWLQNTASIELSLQIESAI